MSTQEGLHEDETPCTASNTASSDQAELFANPEVDFVIPPSEVGRILPLRDVTRDTITDAYVEFILFCNPVFPNTVNTDDLREQFHKPPTTNKKTFDIFDIYNLVKSLYTYGEIKTWHQLAVQMGVEAETAEDGAGSQRIPQYVVRLKRWMRVMHIDAFFHYLTGKPHVYYQNVPPLSQPYPPDGRDGLFPVEDFALRALDPKLRPKRGRKRLEPAMDELPPAQRHTFPPADDRKPQFSTPMSAFPRSAFPNSATNDRMGEPWSSVSTQSNSAMGMSATEPRSAFSAFAADPRLDSMPTPMIANRMNKWASSSPNPANRSPALVKTGHSPSQARSSLPPAAAAATRAASGLGLAVLNTSVGPPTAAHAAEQPTSAVSAASTSSRRERQRLQLQVPKHEGPPIRLMTPPAPAPEEKAASIGAVPTIEDTPGKLMATPPLPKYHVTTTLDGLRRSLTVDLMRAELTGRKARLSGKEARSLAESLLRRLGVGDITMAGIADVISAAVQLGLAHTLDLGRDMGMKLDFRPAIGEKRISVQMWTTNDEDVPEMVQQSGPNDDRDLREVFDVEWHVPGGGLQGTIMAKGLELQAGNRSHDSVSVDRDVG